MNYVINQSQERFLKTLCGKYSNYKQSNKNPQLYANIDIYFRLLPWELFEGVSIYSEQSYHHSPWSPYKQSVLKLSAQKKSFILYNYKIDSPERVAGGGFKLEFLNNIKRDNLHIKKNCEMRFDEKDEGSYIGYLSKCRECIVKKNDTATYLVSEVKLNQNNFISKDEGFDTLTNKKVWGSAHGFLEFERIPEN